MAKSKDNIVTHGLSGKVGNMLVFRQRAGKTIVGKVPVRKGIQPSDKQIAVLEKFQDGVIYAKSAIADPVTKAKYQACAVDGQTAYNLALADYCVAPEIKSIDVSNYNGGIGDTIIVKATDNFMVKGVKLSIQKLDGTMIEEGDALQDEQKVIEWVYTATVTNATPGNIKVVAQAHDLPGNITVKEQVLS